MVGDFWADANRGRRGPRLLSGLGIRVLDKPQATESVPAALFDRGPS